MAMAREDPDPPDLSIWLAVNRRLILASASPARRQLLEWAGLSPEIAVSHVVEDGVDPLPPRDAVLVLAERKARAVAEASVRGPEEDPPIVVGCDSMLEFEGEAWGKPSAPAEVIERWRRLRGRQGLLHTGHFVIDTSINSTAAATDSAVVRFGVPDDREIEAYSRTDEALEVAGPFTLEGRSAPWIESIDGNYGTITGISLPVLRRLLAAVNVEIIDLWS
jgi:septum formation protein